MNDIKLLLKSFSERPIAYYPIYAKITGSITAGILLNQCCYWFYSIDNKEFYKTDKEFCDDLSIGLYELKSAKKRLQELGLISLKRRGVPAKTFYQLHEDILITLITSYGKNPQLVSGKTNNLLVEKPITITETTTEITTETTTELGASAQHPPASSNGSLSGKNGSEGKPARLRKSNADPRTNHPAIKAIFSILGRWPRMQEYDSLIAALGEIPDEERLRECWMEWRRAGPDKHPYSPMNFGWVVDWYVNGIPTKSSSRPSNNLEAEIRRREERLTHGN